MTLQQAVTVSYMVNRLWSLYRTVNCACKLASEVRMVCFYCTFLVFILYIHVSVLSSV